MVVYDHVSSLDHVLVVVPAFGLQSREHHACTHLIQSIPLSISSSHLYITCITLLNHCTIHAYASVVLYKPKIRDS